MTRTEAIDLLDNLIGMVDDNHESDYDTALKMAIESLSVNTCRTCEYYAHERCQKMKIERLDIVPCEFYREKVSA